jgi:hypothetical protein
MPVSFILLLSRSIEIRRGLFPGAVTLIYFFQSVRMLVLIVLIGGNHDLCLGGRAGKMQTSQSFFRNKSWHAPKILLGVLGG